jgi:hypothetical protein
MSCLTAFAVAASGEEGHQHLERAPSSREQPQDADDGSEQCGGRDVTRRRPQDQRDPDRQGRVAEHARQRPVAATRRPDLLELDDSGRGSDRAPLRLLGEAMDCGDLVEPRRRRQPLGRLDRRSLAAAEREEERGREDAEPCGLEPVRACDQGKALLDRVDGLTDRAERRAKIGEEE